MTDEKRQQLARYRKLLWAVVRNARSYYPKGTKHARWIAVKDTCGCGSTSAMELCREFGVDPDEIVTR